MFATYVLLGITHETKDDMTDAYNLEQLLTESLFNYYGDDKTCVNGAIRMSSTEISQTTMDNNIDDIKIFIDNVIKCDEEE